MRIGLIAEGSSDIAVITNILKGITGLDSSDIVPIRPSLRYDKTHKAFLNPDTFSTWSLVRQECIDKKKIEQFFLQEDSKFIIIHIDSAESELYGVKKPNLEVHDYCKVLRDSVIAKINEWLKGEFLNEVSYAVAIEEIDAWVLILFDKRSSCKLPNCKERLNYKLQKIDEDSTVNYSNYLRLSKPLSKKKEIGREKYLDFNCSLKFFYQEIEEKWSKL